MSLSKVFPPEMTIASILRNLTPGSVIKLFVEMDDGAEHEKRFVVLHIDEKTLCCVLSHPGRLDPGGRLKYCG